MIQNRIFVAIVCAFLLLANGILEWMVDNDLGIGWPHNAIRNWQQFGLGALHGKIVTNPGGHDLPEHPDVYPGHRPLTLYPALFMMKAFSWTGFNTLPFHAALSALILFCAWKLLGGNPRAFFISAMLILTPGFVCWPKILDPNTTAALLGIPYGLIMADQFKRERFGSSNFAIVTLTTLIFTALNWTTVLVHAQVFAFLIGLRIPARRMAAYIAAGSVAAILVVVISVRSKAGGPASGGKLGEMLAGYTWGHGGYSDGSSAGVLLVRYAVTNALILLPLWLLLAWTWIKAFLTNRPLALLSLGPLVMAFAGTLGMRNYFCHHPWMAAPVLLVGALFTLSLLRDPNRSPAAAAPAQPASKPHSASWAWTSLAATFCFSFLVMTFYRERNGQFFPLVEILRKATPRSESIAVTRELTPEFANDQLRMEETLDRKLAVSDKLPSIERPSAAHLIISSKALGDEWQLLATAPAKPREVIPGSKNLLDWFGRVISRRKPGDRLEAAVEQYYIYRVPSALIAPATGSKTR